MFRAEGIEPISISQLRSVCDARRFGMRNESTS